MRYRQDDVIGQSGQARLIDGDHTVVRRIEPQQQSSDTQSMRASNDTHLSARGYRHAVLGAPLRQCAAEQELPRLCPAQLIGSAATVAGTAEQHHTPKRDIRRAGEKTEYDQTAEAMADEMSS